MCAVSGPVYAITNIDGNSGCAGQIAYVIDNAHVASQARGRREGERRGTEDVSK